MTLSLRTIRFAVVAILLSLGQLVGGSARAAAPQALPAITANSAASKGTESATSGATDAQSILAAPTAATADRSLVPSDPDRQSTTGTKPSSVAGRPITSAPPTGSSKRAPGRGASAAPSAAGEAPPATAPASASSAPIGAVLDTAAKQDYSSVIRTFVLLSLLSALPILLIGMTSFTRIIIVLSLLRHALGLPETPPNSVLVTLAIFLTIFSMAPVMEQINSQAVQPYLQEKITASAAMDVGIVPLRDFMVRQTRESDLAAVLDMSHAPRPKRVEDIQFAQLAPAFLLSELSTAFQIGFIIFLPFLLVDIVVAAILMALGMIMVPPSTISLPVKILLFILINGWVLVSRALLNSYWS